VHVRGHSHNLPSLASDPETAQAFAHAYKSIPPPGALLAKRECAYIPFASENGACSRWCTGFAVAQLPQRDSPTPVLDLKACDSHCAVSVILVDNAGGVKDVEREVRAVQNELTI
jgi:hypothetical protein